MTADARPAILHLMEKGIAIIYHGRCSDGFGGAWAAWKKFGSNAQYIGASYGEPPRLDIKNKEAYFIDFCYKEEALKELIKNNKRVTLIDHHKTSVDLAPLTHEPLHSNDNSGAVLAWQYFHPKKPVPKLLQYVEDTDIWKFTLPKSKELFAFLETQPYDFNAWNKLANKFERADDRKKFAEKGSAILGHDDALINQLISYNVVPVLFEGREVLSINSPIFHSVLGHRLVEKRPPFAIVWSEQPGERRVSLRSIGDVDVSAIAKKYGGGGHKNASGFEWPIDKPLPWNRLK